MRQSAYSVEFVEFVPNPRQEGVLYVSIAYKTAVHSCACGCGNKVVTPINPAQWGFCWDGDDVTLTPSIGNWQFPCRSHYWIYMGEVIWAPAWSRKRVSAGRERDRAALAKYLRGRQGNN